MKALRSLILIGGLFCSAASYGALISWTSELDGSQEVPEVVTTAAGSAMGTIDTVTGLFSWDIVLVGGVAGVDSNALSGLPVAAHFHNAPAGANGGVVIDLFAASTIANLFPNGGMFIGNALLDAGQVAEMVAGNFYINVHTAANPGGEIRGQVIPVPEPGALGLVFLGLLGLGLARRKRA